MSGRTPPRRGAAATTARQLSFSDDGVGMTGEAMVELADRWVSENRDAWREMTRVALDFAEAGRRFSMETLAQEARYGMRTRGRSQGFKLNNNIRAALARRLVRERPQCRPLVETRASKVDWVA